MELLDVSTYSFDAAWNLGLKWLHVCLNPHECCIDWLNWDGTPWFQIHGWTGKRSQLECADRSQELLDLSNQQLWEQTIRGVGSGAMELPRPADASGDNGWSGSIDSHDISTWDPATSHGFLQGSDETPPRPPSYSQMQQTARNGLRTGPVTREVGGAWQDRQQSADVTSVSWRCGACSSWDWRLTEQGIYECTCCGGTTFTPTGCHHKRRQWHPGLTLIPNRTRKQMSTEAPAQHVVGSLVIQGARTKKHENKQNLKQRQTTPSLIRTHCNRWGVWVAGRGKLLVEMRFRSKEPKTHLQCQPPWILYEIKPMEFPAEHETILPVEIFSPWGTGIGLIQMSGEMMFFANSPRRRMMNGTQRRVRPLAWSIV